MRSILFINYEYPPIGAGAANANYNFAVNMAQKGIKISVLTSAFKSRRGRTVEEKVVVYRIPAFRKHAGRSSLFQMLMFVISAIVNLPVVVKKEAPDLCIIFFTFPCGPLGLMMRFLRNVPFILMLRGGDVPGFEPSLNLIHRLLLPLRRTLYRQSSAVIANSEGLRNLALKTDPGFKIHLVPNGVDTDFFSPPGTSIHYNDEFFFLFAGRFCEQKNIGTLVTAFKLCLSSHQESRLILMGEGPSEKSIRSLAATSMVKERLRWVRWGTKEAVRSVYRSSHCFVIPSLNEGMSNAVLEAMACGLPVIGGDCIGNREVISHGETGYLFNSGDPGELAEYMIALVNDRVISQKLGQNGRKICCERFSWRMMTEKLSELLDEKITDPAYSV